MARPITYVLIVLCVLVALWGLVDQPKAPSASDELAGTSLKLLAELSDEELGALALPVGAGEILDDVPVQLLPYVSQEPASEVVVAPGPKCLLVGELRDIDEAERLEQMIEDKGASIISVTRIIEELGPYMVYVQPKASAAEALEIVEALRESRVESLIIRDGTYENGVSLGVFRSEENSAALVSRVRALGYDVRRRRMSVQKELYSLQVSGSVVANIEEVFWQDIRSNYEGVKVEEKNCDEVASAGNFQ